MINPRSKVPFGEIHESRPFRLAALNSRLFLSLLSDIHLRKVGVEDPLVTTVSNLNSVTTSIFYIYICGCKR